jgi:hypothetical protein
MPKPQPPAASQSIHFTVKLIRRSLKKSSITEYSRVFLAAIAACCVLLVLASRREIQRVDRAAAARDSASKVDEFKTCPKTEADPIAALQAPLQNAEGNSPSRTAPQAPEKRQGAPSNVEISQLLNQARHKVMPINGAATELEINRGASHFMQNSGQSLTARFGEGGVRLGSSKGESWQVALHYSGASAASTMQPEGSRMNIQHPDGVMEWYENSAQGIEHGFILGTRATDTGTRDIRVSMDGMVAIQSGNDLIWSLPNGINALAYSGLQVKDATGAAITAEMRATRGGLTIQLQDAHAVYPVYVDPVITRVTAKLSPINLGDGNAGDYFGNAISTDGQTLVVGALKDNEGRGSVYIFTRIAGEWIFKSKLNPTGTFSYTRFGTSVALQGNILVVGSPGDGYYGAGYIYEKVSDEWTLSAKVSTPQSIYYEGNSIGCSVAVDDGVVMVGADGYTGGSPAVIGKGYVFVFEKVSGVWTQQVRLEDPAGTTNDEYGAAISIKNGYAYIGKPGKNAGEVMIYKKVGSSWTFVTRLYGVSTGGRFGECLATDGSALAVGAPFDDTAVAADVGSVQVFRKSGEAWASEGILTATDAVSYDYFGTSVAIEGSRLLIGAIRGYSSYGCAYIFEKTTNWSQKTRLVPYNTSIDGRSGHCVALVGDAVWVGAYHSDTYAHWYAGIVNEYRLRSGVWEYTDLITAGDSGFYMNFGSALDLDGQRIVVGAPGDASPYGQRTGSVYVFMRVNDDWEIETILMDDTPMIDEHFGSAVDIDGDCLMVGTPADVKMSTTPGDVSLYRFGSVTCFRRSANGWAAETKMRPTILSASSSDEFGASISLRGDTVLIGAPLYTTAIPGISYNAPGAGFLFSKVNGAWAQQARLMVAGSTSFWKVGSSVALGDGRLFLSAPQRADASYHYGRIFEFTGSGTNWTEGSSIGPSNWEGYETFGSSIALDGDCLIVGSRSDYAGAGQKAHVFRRSGSIWEQEAVLASPDAADGKNHTFGAYVALKGDLALVSDTDDYVLGQPSGGSIHVFRKQSGLWSRDQKLIAPDASSNAQLGTPIVTDGTSVLTAAANETIANPLTGDITDYRGSVYLFELGEAYKTLEVIRQDNFSNELTFLPRTGHTLSFPWTIVGGSQQPEKLILRNNGVVPVSGISIAIEGTDASQFYYQNYSVTSIPTTLAPGAEVIVNLSFSPTVSGVNKSASLRVTSDDGEGDYLIGISGLANTKPQKTGGTYTCFAGQPFVIFAKDLAMDPDGHSFVLNSDGTTTLQGATMTASGNKLTFVPNAGFTGNIIFWYYITDEYGAYSQIVNTMNVVADPAADDAAAAQPIKRLNANTLGVLLKGESGITYQIQRSFDLQTWETLGSAAPVSSGDLMFMDYQNAYPRAYYRLIK